MIDPDGAVSWERPARVSVRSDSHQITVEFGSDLVVYGSPAPLVTGRMDNVFGSDDVLVCAGSMLCFVSASLGVSLPSPLAWSCTRIDVTENYHLGALGNVKQALELLRHAEGGRYQVRTAAESVYWSERSTYRSGKAYAKGPHMEYLKKRRRESLLNSVEMAQVSGLLRLELSLRRHFFSRLLKGQWFDLKASDLRREHAAYFGKLIGTVEVTETMNVRLKLIEAAISLGMSAGCGASAFASWNWIRTSGFADWRDGMSRASFYRHKKILQAAGLSYTDFAARNVVVLRRRLLVLEAPVRNWSELRAAA